jgi:competence protein ComEC
MLNKCAGVLSGAYTAAMLPVSLSVPICVGLLSLAIAMNVICRVGFSAYFFAGLAIMGMTSGAQLDDRLAGRLDGQDVRISVRIDDFVEVDRDSIRFTARPLEIRELPSRVRLTWFRPEAIPRVGDVWRLQVRLRRPHGYANPGGFDYEGWLFRQRIGATGYVIAEAHNYRIDGELPGAVDAVRRNVADKITAVLPVDHSSAVLLAITVGARHLIDRQQWDIYAMTGTSHLMAISGLHIGLAAGSALVLCWGLLAAWPGRRNLRDLALAGALVAALVYAALSGFAVPARRAVVMAGLVACALLLRRRIRPGSLLATTCFIIFMTDPLAILAPGFKLSFAAVGVLFLAANPLVILPERAQLPRIGVMLNAAIRLGLIQIALLVGLFPLTVTEFDRFTALAPFVNLVVLPVFNLVTVPLSLAGTLLGAVLPGPENAFLNIAHESVQIVHGFLQWTAGHAGVLSFRTSIGVPLLSVLLPALYVVLPAGWPGRRLAILAIVSVITFRPNPPPETCFDFHALDVGQGLAVVVQTRSKSLLFDTGPACRKGADAAGFTFLPFLAGIGIRRLDRVVVSHPDLDHAGGIRSTLESVEVGRVMVGEPMPQLGRAQTRCVAGTRWNWDGVEFRVLHPRQNSPWTGNNSSCVLEVAAGTHRLLLPGDIESPVEKLLEYYEMLRPSQVVLVPHHGSGTSSDWSLVRTTIPALAVVSAGYRNRWGLPREDVVARWQRVGTRVVNTAISGAISQRICKDGGASALQEARQERVRMWHDDPA